MITWVESQGARLAVYVTGQGQDAVVLLHGGPGVPDYLAPVGDLLAPRHTVIRYDQRGTGRSSANSGQFGLAEQLADLEAIRTALGHERISLFGHSWGGTLAQLYAKEYPTRVSSLFLSNSGIGLGEDWRHMERAVMLYNRARGGLNGFMLLGLYQVMSMLPGKLGDVGARKLMALVWRNYFDPPSSAPAPDPIWLEGVHSRPIHATRAAALRAKKEDLVPAPGANHRVLVLFGASDIYGETVERIFARFPQGRRVVLDSCGHIPWLQNPGAFRAELCTFFGC